MMEFTLGDELWKDIPDLGGIYQVSNKGNVRSKTHMVKCKDGRERLFGGRVLKLPKNADGYPCLVIRQRGSNIVKSYKVHRLVAEAFIGNPNRYTEVNHIDEDKANNIATNLEWCDRLHNCNHGTRNARISKSHSREIVLIKPNQTPITMESQNAAAKWLGVKPQSIAYAIKRKTRCKGYRCEFTQGSGFWLDGLYFGK